MTKNRQLPAESFRKLRFWKRRDERAPHKPLLLLMALGKVRKGIRWLTYHEVDQQLRRLLERYGPERRSVHPEYPFWRLQNDGIWVVSADGPLERRQGNTDPMKSELLRLNARGGFTQELYEVLSRDPELVRDLAEELLETHFPADVHKSILADVGLSK